MNEDWLNRGWGRLDYQVSGTVDGDGAKAYTYQYHPGTEVYQYKWGYREADYSDMSNPSFWNLAVKYEYDTSGTMRKKTVYNDSDIAIGSGSLQYFIGGKLMSEVFNGTRYHYMGFSTVGYSSLQDAVNHCTFDGDVIVIKGGTINLNGSNVIVNKPISFQGGYYENGSRDKTGNTTMIQNGIFEFDEYPPIEISGIAFENFPPSEIKGISVSGNDINLTFSTKIGYEYTVQYTTNLVNGTWENVDTVEATEETTTRTIANPNKTGFYRIITSSMFGGLVIPIFGKARKIGGTDADIEIVVGVPESLQNLVSQSLPLSLQKAGIQGEVQVIGLDESTTRGEMLEKLNEGTKGRRVITLLLDWEGINRMFVGGRARANDVNEIIIEFAKKAQQDIIPLTHPEIAGINETNIDKIDSVDTLRGIMPIYARLLPEIESLDLMSKSVYDMRINNYHRLAVPEDVLSNEAREYLKEISQKETRYASISARSAADLRLIANAIRDMGLTKEAASKLIQVRLTDANIDKDNLPEYMKATGIDQYLEEGNIVNVTNRKLTLKSTLEVVRETFGDAQDGQIVIGDTEMLVTEGEEKLLQGANTPVYVQMQGPGIASQLLLTMIEIVANDGEISAELGKVEKQGALNWYVYLPNIEKVDYNALQKEIEHYEQILIMA